MSKGLQKDGAIRKNCGQESYGFGNARGERMSYFEAKTTGIGPAFTNDDRSRSARPRRR